MTKRKWYGGTFVYIFGIIVDLFAGKYDLNYKYSRQSEGEEIQMMDLNKQIGERVYLTRIMRGYTRECLAELADISSKFLYEIETGKKGFSVSVLCRLCVALDVDYNAILTGDMKVEYDGRLMKAVQQFDEGQARQISNIIEVISDLLKDRA